MKKLMYLYFWGQDIHLDNFLKKHPNADSFFSSENGGGSIVFFSSFFYLFQIDQKLTKTSSTMGFHMYSLTGSKVKFVKIDFFLQFQLFGPFKIKYATKPINHSLGFSPYFDRFSEKLERTYFEIFSLKDSHSKTTNKIWTPCKH